MSDIAIQNTGTARGKVLVGGLVLVVAVGLFAAAFIYAGGVEIVSKLVAGTGAVQTAAAPTPPPSQASASKPAAPAAAPLTVAEDFGDRIYLEQLESAGNIAKLASGKVKSFAVTKVEKNAAGTMTGIYITATFKDGTSGPGCITLWQDAGVWYVMAIEGLKLPGAGDQSSVHELEPGWDIETRLPLAQVMASVGVKSIDHGVVDTLLATQKTNQDVLATVMDGTYNAMAMGTPVKGAGTITIPVDVTGKQSMKAQFTIITKRIEGRDRLFVTGFKKL